MKGKEREENSFHEDQKGSGTIQRIEREGNDKRKGRDKERGVISAGKVDIAIMLPDLGRHR